ncbi:MAG: ATP-binding cassette domain-containing protein, partial [Jeotgalicoccus sp.]|nr:ATP-binding cassette domain-containing protein [Jeotgalicoccus sp.]
MTMIQVDDLKKSFGSEDALRGITFNVERGEIFGLLGPSGSGKTTTIKIMTGEFKPSGGDVHVNSYSYKQFSKNDYVSSLGILSDKSSLYDRLTV